MSHAGSLYDTQALRALEAAAAIATGDAFEPMRRAGLAAWRHLLGRWPAAQRIVVACGPGNNGGDGYLLAMHALEGGRSVHMVHLAEHMPRGALARRARQAFEAAGGRTQVFDGTLPAADVVVDALFGVGLSRVPDTATSVLIDAINLHAGTVFALDVPSGVDAGSGNVPGVAVRATATLQFMGAHRGLATGAALDHVGERAVAALGIDAMVFDGVGASAHVLDRASLHAWLRPRERDSHKGDNGHLLCVGGELGSGGAIALCAEAALRSGAGLASVATRAGHMAALLARRPEAMVHGVEGADDLQPLLYRASVVAVGPGLGQGDWGAQLHDAAMGCGRPLVIDADALNLLARAPRELPAETVLTPHPGEAARLLGIPIAEVQADRFAAARALVRRFGCVVVLKGAGTIVDAPGCIPCVVAAGNPGMATGGMGDVLTGVIGALRAQGFDGFRAACCGALLHAAAGDDAAGEGGERGLLPSDLFAHLRSLANPDLPR